MESGLDNEVVLENSRGVPSQSSAIQEEVRNDVSGNEKPLLFNVNTDSVSDSSSKLSVPENNDLSLPLITINDGSPTDFKQQSEGYRINTSEYITPGTSIDRSSTNSYVTAKDGTSSGCSNPSLRNMDATVGTKSNGRDENSHSSELTTVSSPFEEFSSSSGAETSKDLSINPSSKDLASPSDEFSLTPSINSTRESSEPFGESDEEYFEEFHLPNTHENAFVRHLSFRRKVQTTPIHAPDADRIEGLVRTGEFVRHGSIRKKIVPEEEEEEEEQVDEDFEGENDSLSFSKSIEREIRNFERYLSKENLDEFHADTKMPTSPETFDKLKYSASTPKSNMISETNANLESFNDSSHNDGIIPSAENFEQNVSIEESTLRKIQECLDFSAYKDILNFSGRLSDILSPKEVEEVLSNSERYRQYLDTEVFEALSLSYQEQFHSLPGTVNLSKSSSVDNNISSNSSSNKCLPTTDSGFSSPITPKKEEEILETQEESPRNSLQFVERSGTACDGIGAQGIFVETVGLSAELKKISAPPVNLDWSSDTKGEEDDDDEKDDSDLREMPTRRKITISKDILELSDNQDHIDVATEAFEKDICEARNENHALTNFEIGSEILPHEISAIPPPPDLIPELTASEEMAEVRHWRNVVIGGAWRRIDMKAIAPYRKCISHGGYMDDTSQSPIVVISAARLPDKSRKDYHYIMDNLFMYVLSFLEQLVADDYVLIYFSGGRTNGSGPGFHWMRGAYEMIDRRLRKNLKTLLIVHPSLWAKTILTLSRPFISSKFYRKLKFVQHLTDLAMLVPLEQLEIPDAVKQADFEIMIREKKKLRSR